MKSQDYTNWLIFKPKSAFYKVILRIVSISMLDPKNLPKIFCFSSYKTHSKDLYFKRRKSRS